MPDACPGCRIDDRTLLLFGVFARGGGEVDGDRVGGLITVEGAAESDVERSGEVGVGQVELDGSDAPGQWGGRVSGDGADGRSAGLDEFAYQRSSGVARRAEDHDVGG